MTTTHDGLRVDIEPLLANMPASAVGTRIDIFTTNADRLRYRRTGRFIQLDALSA